MEQITIKAIWLNDTKKDGTPYLDKNQRPPEEALQSLNKIIRRDYFMALALSFLIFFSAFVLASPRTTVTPIDNPQEPSSVMLKIPVGTTAVVYDELYISLIQTMLLDNPSEIGVKAIIRTADRPDIGIDQAEVGYTLSYIGKNSYHIKVIGIDKFSATFLLTKE